MPSSESKRADDRGSASVELLLLAPVLVAALLLMVIAGRQVSASLIVQEAAYTAARTASLQNSAAAAPEGARRAAARELRDRGVVCEPFSTAVDTSDFAPAGSVGVRVSCTVTVVDLGGWGGSRVVRSEAVSPVDPHREALP
ncbi:TadE/TadG family type IV pilus assembly protein [Nocardiopsis changdeensis]|uniref:TadE/TadG family type IV pilus assembly protein n=1 Tax=Nocardiopsis TaxID=2013 RepID=UPI002103F83A|nr:MULTISPECIES: TadE/TadG family type IV pilus assembly protein [Nocardiopsis]